MPESTRKNRAQPCRSEREKDNGKARILSLRRDAAREGGGHRHKGLRIPGAGFVHLVRGGHVWLYFCMYAFRKPFTAGAYTSTTFWGADYKTVLVVAQVLGYAVSKFVGISVVAEVQPCAWAALLGLIARAEVALVYPLIPLLRSMSFGCFAMACRWEWCSAWSSDSSRAAGSRALMAAL